ncbi:nucleotidyltransferase [Massilia eurypsychrophila]|uniref:Nucleotidyltransferase n=1 Tax=Massilia eurypsychrophila TaxID=1485217 RepID=A0A2G8TCC3_9BURK|nr:HI0074 family nucleotidyltransferase substrate-binding subunit [Massilia eurypsychrophila]PIL43653.1 nucleotidyltransferase [Massilia eurypsychrophila]
MLHGHSAFRNFKKALGHLEEADQLSGQRQLSRLEKLGFVNSFELTYELAWNSLRDYLTVQGVTGLIGVRDTALEAFRRQSIADGDGWMAMLTDKERGSLTYNQATADDIVEHIDKHYIDMFRQLSVSLELHTADK